ncbi:hypothetical protein RZS08_06600, partial [Arthrospira platensis SPKY1]|nr:hypothetical protein [Arthrospira platensis SPKY1]
PARLAGSGEELCGRARAAFAVRGQADGEGVGPGIVVGAHDGTAAEFGSVAGGVAGGQSGNGRTLRQHVGQRHEEGSVAARVGGDRGGVERRLAFAVETAVAGAVGEKFQRHRALHGGVDVALQPRLRAVDEGALHNGRVLQAVGTAVEVEEIGRRHAVRAQIDTQAAVGDDAVGAEGVALPADDGDAGAVKAGDG